MNESTEAFRRDDLRSPSREHGDLAVCDTDISMVSDRQRSRLCNNPSTHFTSLQFQCIVASDDDRRTSRFYVSGTLAIPLNQCNTIGECAPGKASRCHFQNAANAAMPRGLTLLQIFRPKHPAYDVKDRAAKKW